MDRESNNDPIAIQSSIALLQERFRQLQRVKEMREEREINRLLIKPKPFDTPMHYEPSNSRLFFHFLPPRSSSSSALPQVSLSLWSNSVQANDADFQCMQTPTLTSLRPSKETSSMHASSENFDVSKYDDVDTSLHL